MRVALFFAPFQDLLSQTFHYAEQLLLRVSFGFASLTLPQIRFLDYRRFIILRYIPNCLRNFPFRRIIHRDVLEPFGFIALAEIRLLDYRQLTEFEFRFVFTT